MYGNGTSTWEYLHSTWLLNKTTTTEKRLLILVSRCTGWLSLTKWGFSLPNQLSSWQSSMVAGNGGYACTQQQGFPSTKANLMAFTNKCPNKINSFRQTIYLTRDRPSDHFYPGEVRNLSSSEETFILCLDMISCHTSTNTIICGLTCVLTWDSTVSLMNKITFQQKSFNRLVTKVFSNS